MLISSYDGGACTDVPLGYATVCQSWILGAIAPSAPLATPMRFSYELSKISALNLRRHLSYLPVGMQGAVGRRR